jgi:hypothetical protein
VAWLGGISRFVIYSTVDGIRHSCDL